MAKRREYKITNAINRVGDEVNSILNKRRSTRYFEAIVVIYSLVENVLKWLVYLKIVWDKCDRVLPDDELNALRQFCNQQDFYSAQNLALVTGLIDGKLFKQIDKVRRERNDILHQCYLFTHRKNRRTLRAKLEKLARVADRLIGTINKLVEETGADDSYDIFMVRRGRQMLT